MLRRVVEFITRYNMIKPGSRVGIAVSGGADSVCLLHLLYTLAPEWNLALTVLHLNHKLRGVESEEDEQFVRSLAESLSLPAIVESWQWGGPEGMPAQASGPHPLLRGPDSGLQQANLEAAAREARLAFFARAAASTALDCVALGHTRSDQAETVLFRLLRGAGTAGLSGIRPVTPAGIVRPLLAVTRGEVESYLRDRGIAWREDSSN
ncbi:MAG TPA: tRNA lysidine(34) synthetase, partial [Bryobacteraceae bacterium]|nr:tRNA lysidine(34) synthetase [Bryobacteraceae bacterium]